MALISARSVRRSVPGGAQVSPTTFPELKYMLHMDNVLIGNANWQPRRGSIVQGGGAVTWNKDASGAKVATTIVTLTSTGTMPVIPVGKYAAIVTVGKPGPSDHVLDLDFGDRDTGDSFWSNGAAYYSVSGSPVTYVSAVPSNGIGLNLPGFGINAAHISYVDCKSTVNPSAWRAWCPVDQTTYGAARSTDNTVIIPPATIARNTAFGNIIGMDSGGIGFPNDQHYILGGLFLFDEPISKDEGIEAVVYMADHPGLLPSWWK